MDFFQKIISNKTIDVTRRNQIIDVLLGRLVKKDDKSCNLGPMQMSLYAQVGIQIRSLLCKTKILTFIEN